MNGVVKGLLFGLLMVVEWMGVGGDDGCEWVFKIVELSKVYYYHGRGKIEDRQHNCLCSLAIPHYTTHYITLES